MKNNRKNHGLHESGKTSRPLNFKNSLDVKGCIAQAKLNDL